MADWQSAGFMHGVMNTDNFSILGLTLDYGPYGFMEAYEPGHICNHTDHSGRYAFDQQPGIGLWNCTRSPMRWRTSSSPRSSRRSSNVCAVLREAFLTRTRAKLGLANAEAEDDRLGQDLRAAMAAAKSASHARFACSPTFVRRPRPRATAAWPRLTASRSTGARRHRRRGGLDRPYQQRLEREARPAAERAAAMSAVNPRIVLRNHLAKKRSPRPKPVTTSRCAASSRPCAGLQRRPDVAVYDRPAPAGPPMSLAAPRKTQAAPTRGTAERALRKYESLCGPRRIVLAMAVAAACRGEKWHTLSLIRTRTPEEQSRRTFMVNAVLALGG